MKAKVVSIVLSNNDNDPKIQNLEFSITLSAKEWKLENDFER